LQELLAPATVEFFSKEGKQLGSKISLKQEIHEITEIPIEVLKRQSFTEFSVKERMSWAAKRTTTLKEDKVYCLLGIFEVFLSLIYGEGEAYATLRLEEEIQKRQNGRGTESLQDLTGTFSFRQSSFFFIRVIMQLTMCSVLVVAFPKERTFRRTRKPASISRAIPSFLQYSPTHNNIWIRRLW
jgi:hypothetical protein